MLNEEGGGRDVHSSFIIHHSSFRGVAVTDPPADVFADLFRLLTPERLLRHPRATGEGVAVCVIDSGVERSVLEEKFARRGQAIHPVEGGIFTAEAAGPLPYAGRQSAPHGTTVADVVLTVAPRVRLFSADV